MDEVASKSSTFGPSIAMYINFSSMETSKSDLLSLLILFIVEKPLAERCAFVIISLTTTESVSIGLKRETRSFLGNTEETTHTVYML